MTRMANADADPPALCRLRQLINQTVRAPDFGIDVDLTRASRVSISIRSAHYAAAATTFATSTNVSENVGALP